MVKNRQKIGFGSVLASIWEGVGAAWGRFWALLVASWWLFGSSKSSFCKALGQDRLQEAFGVDFGGIWGGIWEDFGRIFANF